MIKSTVLILAFISCAQGSYFSQTWNTFTTTFGNIQLGPADANWGHIYTDRPKFLFNKDVYLTTGGINSISGVGLSLKTNGTTRMYFNPTNGWAGIGTTTPQEAFHIGVNTLIQVDKRLKFGSEYANSGSLQIHNSASSYGTYFDFDGNLYFRRFNHAGTNLGALLGLQNDGTVTIGVWEHYDNLVTNTEGYKLMVNGGMLCEKVKVINDVPNSDHVFTKEYKLMTLDDLKLYIENNKHLPEIPSAKEFQENGYSLGEMDDLLLRKVEELTLYIFQLEERLKEQQMIINELNQN